MRRWYARLRMSRRDIDRWAVIYLVVSGFYPMISRQPASGPWLRLALHLLLAATFWIVPARLRLSGTAGVRLLGEIYLPFIFPLFYGEMAQLGLVFYDFEHSLDPWFIRLEELLFGGQLSLVWSQRWPWPWLHELLEFAYFSYYFFALAVLILILRARALTSDQRWDAVRAFMRDLGGTMLVCYTLYTFFPVWGPKYFKAGPVTVDGWIFTRIMRGIHEHGAILGAAFPSSHVAATLIPWWHAWKVVPRSRPWLTPLFVLLCAATVYCRYHYVVDVIGGLLLGALMLWLGARYGERKLRLPRAVRAWGGQGGLRRDGPAA